MPAMRPLFSFFLVTALITISANMSLAQETQEAATELKIKQEATRSTRRMAFQFDSSRSLNGFLLNTGHIDVRVDGYVVKIPMTIVDAVRFSKDFGGDCSVRLSNGNSLQGVISKFDFEVATDWGTVDISRPTLLNMSAIEPPKNPPRLNAPKPATAPQPRAPAVQELPNGRTSAFQPANVFLPELAITPRQRQVIMESPHPYF